MLKTQGTYSGTFKWLNTYFLALQIALVSCKGKLTIRLSTKQMCLKNVRCARRRLGDMAAQNSRTLQTSTHACNLAYDVSCHSAPPTSTITAYSIIMTITLSVLSLGADVRQSHCRAVNIWHTSWMPHHRSDVLDEISQTLSSFRWVR